MNNKTVQNAFFIGLLVLTTVAFFGLVREFLQPIFWAAVLATLFYGLHRRYVRWVGGRKSIGAVLTLLTILVIVIAPLLAVIAAAAQEAIAVYERLDAGGFEVQDLFGRLESYLPIVSDYAEQFGSSLEQLREGLSNAAVAVSRFIGSQALAVGQGAARFTLLLFLMLYILFFFLRDGERLVDTLIAFLPLGDDRERELLTKFAEVSRATIKGTLVVAVVQGALGGILFWILGIGAPVFWGVVMTLLSLLPAVGTVIIWLPAAIYLLATGAVVKGLILLAVGTLLIGLVDNVLRPILVGRDTKMPDFLILLATLGGLAVFGLSGFVIGPLIAAFFLAVWQMFRKSFDQMDDDVAADARRPVEPPPVGRTGAAEGAPEETGRLTATERVLLRRLRQARGGRR